jgi:hypothetical protein
MLENVMTFIIAPNWKDPKFLSDILDHVSFNSNYWMDPETKGKTKKIDKINTWY